MLLGSDIKNTTGICKKHCYYYFVILGFVINAFTFLRVLILHLKRYGYDNLTEEQAKKQDKVNIERFIDLSKCHNLST